MTTGAADAACTPSIEWLVTTMSAAAAAARAASGRHTSPNGHRDAPTHSLVDTLTVDQDASLTVPV